MGTVLGAGGADAACRPVVWEGLVVDDERGEKVGVDGIEKVKEVAVVVARGVCRDDFGWIGDAPRGEFADGDERFPEMRVFGADPCGADDVLEGVVLSEMLLAEHEGEIEIFGGLGLFRAVVSVDVVVECLKRTFADATAVQLDADAFSILRGPCGGLFDVFQITVVFTREVEFVEDVGNGFEANRAVRAQIDGGADADGWKLPSDDGGDERRRRRDNIGKQADIVHLSHDICHQIRKFLADSLFTIAVAVEERVEAEAVRARPRQIRNEPFTEFKCEVRGGAA